jgi:hypothetical protein
MSASMITQSLGLFILTGLCEIGGLLSERGTHV